MVFIDLHKDSSQTNMCAVFYMSLQIPTLTAATIIRMTMEASTTAVHQVHPTIHPQVEASHHQVVKSRYPGHHF
jgi:hypothetical protein